MKKIKQILIILILILSFTSISDNTIYAETININIDSNNGGENNVSNNLLDNFGKDESEFFGVNIKGANGIYYTLLTIAQSLKNLFFFLATLFYLIIAIKLLAAENTEEEASKFKKGIIWITIGLIIMQIAYSVVLNLYAQKIGEESGTIFINNIINPFIGLIEVLASFIFLAMMIYAFYKMVTANGKEEEVTKSKMTILYAIIGFILLKLAKTIVEGVYGKLECKATHISGFEPTIITCIGEKNASGLVGNILQIINWMNGFIGIVTILLIIYVGFNILFSAGDEEKIKKAKSTIIYIIIGILLLVINYLLLTFFILPQTI